MESARGGGQQYDYHSHSGLEVVPPNQLPQQPGLEVRDNLYHDAKELVIPKYPETYTGESPVSSLPPPPHSEYHAPPDARPRRKRMWIIIGGLIALVVVLAAVLGGVFGSRAAKSASDSDSAAKNGTASPDATAGPSPGSNSTTSPLKNVRQGSALTVAGWRKPDGNIEKYLFYQDPTDGLRYSRCNSTQPLAGQDSCWGPSRSFFSFSQPNSQLGVGLLIFATRHQPQVELFYTGESTRLLGTNFNDQSKPSVAEDSVTEMEIVTGVNSSLTSYWPWTIYQDGSGGLLHVRNQLGGGWSPASIWDVNRINITAMMGTKLAMVPLSANFTRIAVKAGYAVFYQALDGTLSVAATDINSPERDPSYAVSWPTQLPPITMPKLAPIGAFSVARPSDGLQRVDTYVLWIDDSSNVNMLYTDSSSGNAVWKTKQPTSLRGLDKDSNLACLNMGTSPQNAANTPILLDPASDEIRCFFQKGGLIMEAKLDGTDWTVTGSVPIG
ncbi:hypothetical protein QBC47DRAFT_120912 [Echria macrotheca]|uniref:Fucose-specific lectin n=1 Tax=Echria macrotheca TaxID=438768 RepID=A0AAJ0F6S0_9PEZI|nr:hypothetical protein QBC47DRAFT_120912 [Echria macrotheca]